MTVENSVNRVPDESVIGPDWLAYQKALATGQFSTLKPGSWVAFKGGQFVGTSDTYEALVDSLHKAGIDEGYFYHQPKNPEPVFHLRHPRRIVRRL